jgi:hypothetical protein
MNNHVIQKTQNENPHASKTRDASSAAATSAARLRFVET